MLINEAEVRSVFGVAEAYGAVETAMAMVASDDVCNAPRERRALGSVTLNIMMASSASLGRLALKVYPVLPDRHATQGVDLHISLYDTSSGRLLAVVSADRLTRLRTAASTLVAISRLAPEPDRVVLYGAGRQAATHVEAILTLLPSVSDLAVIGRDGARTQAFVAGFADDRVRAGRAVLDVPPAAVVILATNSARPVLEARQLSSPTLVIAVGSNRRDHREIDGDLVRSADEIFVDDLEAARRESGDLILAGIDWDHVRTLPVTPRSVRPALMLFESQGLAAFDLLCAQFVYQQIVGEPHD